MSQQAGTAVIIRTHRKWLGPIPSNPQPYILSLTSGPQANLDCATWQLPGKDFAALSRLPYQRRMVDGSFWINPR
jgi:hypothetical protein